MAELPVSKSSTSRFFQSVQDAKTSIQGAIYLLEQWEKKITEKNYSQYGLTINEHRDIEPVFSDSQVAFFRQLSPVTLTIVAEDFSMLGQDLKTPENSPWNSPSPSEVAAVDSKLKGLMKKKANRRGFPRRKKA